MSSGKILIHSFSSKNKKSFSNYIKKENFSTPNLFLPSSSQQKKITNSNKKISLKNVFKKPKNSKNNFQFKILTKPKLPFSSRNTLTKEQIKEKIKLSSPSRLIHNFINIQWLKKKFPETVINKSIYSLLPGHGKPVVPEDESEEDKRHRLIMEFLDEEKNRNNKFQYYDINPKYLYNKQTWETVLKLRRIFLDFDADGNRKMELDEMQEMFESNKIFVSINDLVSLFFKGQKFKPQEIMKLYLKFHQFINFALTKDEEFREFMRRIRQKSEKNEEKNTNKNNTNNGQYLPMTFKSLMDYFVDRGKQRDSEDIINKAINNIDKIINESKKIKKENLLEKKKNFNFSKKYY